MRSIRLLAGALALAACGEKGGEQAADFSYQETLQTQLLDARPGDVIEISAGTFHFDRSLSLAVDGVTIRGQGMDKTILSFRNQIAGAEGLLVTASDFVIEDLAIEDTKGDALKVTKGDNIVIRRVRTEWTGGPKTENGAYGIYPVQTTNVLLEGNVAIGASDAGIYVGQSRNVIVRGNRAERNVAGIEIENTFDADVYDNVATENTGGVLVFNMPNLSQPGARTRVFRNRIIDNNTKNFGHPGTAVANVPAGSGIIINANDQVEIFDNDIEGNGTASIIIASVFSSGLSQDGMTEDFDPYPESIFIYGNRMSGGGKKPDGLDLQALKVAKFGPLGALPDILWDGYVDPAKMENGALPDSLRICVRNDGAALLNLDAPNGFRNPQIATGAHDCALEKLPAVSLDGRLAEL
ncbi:parallel beta-helix domain-containing protein [Amphiplicatus metriothermophilus]|uniref:Parallel beta-helix repeat-containing protein n=1 Tax=Amphiplicatus metriothermophilus TaxID=1519374 RepID=A0A239PV06_9PROT|nr:parallel beta-helix domain-containing protein [Amphiplicatus metriothermophilus]MBB5519528.1 parallel beta-helix repeat protein [Amphiplicatus metriothermophilus]SNT74095.1 parallel beta-helix repeat-containing protein [Amphiplicatus metriothermophilus]